MATDFKLPNLGENIEEGDVVKVLVKEGDEIKAGQAVVEIETDKAVVEVPCNLAGKVTKVYVQAGTTAKIGQPLIAVEGAAAGGKSAPAAPDKPAKAAAPEKQPAKPAAAEKAEKPAAKPKQPEAPAKQPASKSPAKNGPIPRQPVADHDDGEVEDADEPEDSGGARKAAPAVASVTAAAAAGPATRRLARELGVDIGRVRGSGTGGRITREDIVAAVRQGAAAANKSAAKRSSAMPEGTADQDAYGSIRRQKLSKIRRTIAVNMAKSASTIPHVTNFDDADITELERIRKTSMADAAGSNVKLTMMAFLMKAVAQSLKLHPVINASIDLDGGEVLYKEYVSLGVAVDTERGLVVPVIRDVDQLTIPNIAQALQDIATRARNNQFTIEELRGGTFTISNLGAIGGTYSTPIINHPEVAVLLAGRSRQLPVIVDDKIVPRLMMPLSLSYDHRLVDGAAAARFLNEVKSFLQVPGRLLLAS